MTKTKANALWNQLREGLVNTEAVLIEIIKTKAWEPLGYATFVEAWNDRLQGVRLANSDMLRAYVVYQMVEDGLKFEEIVGATGIADTRVKNLIAAKKKGTPASIAKSLVRQHLRSPRVESHVLHIELTAGELADFREAAKRLDFDLQEEAREVVRQHFERLVQALRVAV